MNRIASTNKQPRIVAKLDLADEGQRRLHDFIRRTHTGRWPLFRCLGMRQINGVLFEAVEWIRRAKPTFNIVEWRPDGLGMRFHPATSARQAKRVLAALT